MAHHDHEFEELHGLPSVPTPQEEWELAPTLMSDVLLRLGLTRTPVADPLAILHREDSSWQERVAALQAMDVSMISDSRQLLLSYIHDESLHEAVSVAAAQALSTLIKHDPELIGTFCNVWGSVRAAARVAFIDSLSNTDIWTKPLARSLLLTALKDPDDDACIAAFQCVGSLTTPLPDEVWLHSLKSPSWRVREAAILALGNPEELNIRLRTALVQALYDKSKDVRHAAITLFHDDLPLDLLITELLSGLSVRRKQAARVLGEIGRQEALRPLIDILRDSYDTSVRVEALLALGTLGEQITVPPEPLIEATLDPAPRIHELSILILDALYPDLLDGDTLKDPPIYGRYTYNPLPERLGGYTLKHIIAEDPQVLLYLGKHIQSQQLAAIKIYRRALSPTVSAAFKKRTKSLFGLKHPHIALQIDASREKEILMPYIIRAYTPQGSILHRYPRGTRLPLDLVLSYVHQIAEALQYAHDRWITHFNLKPENILLNEAGKILICDFGLPMQIDTLTYHRSRPHTSTHHPLYYRNSPHTTGNLSFYTAPESLVDNENIRPPRDQYALAVIVCEWLYGELPFLENDEHLSSLQREQRLSSLQEHDTVIPPSIKKVIMRALSREPAHRFPCIQDFAHALQQARSALQGFR